MSSKAPKTTTLPGTELTLVAVDVVEVDEAADEAVLVVALSTDITLGPLVVSSR